MPLLIPAGILGGTSLLSGLLTSNAATSAAQTQASAAEQASQTQLGEFDQTQGNLAPFLGVGQAAEGNLYSLLGLYPGGSGPFSTTSGLTQSPFATLGAPPTYSATAAPQYNQPQLTAAQFQNTPGYQFSLNQGLQGVQNAASPTGGLYSGNTLKALQTYGTGQADQNYWTAYNANAQQYQNQYNSQASNYTNQINSQGTNYWNQYNAMAGQQNQLFNYLSSLAGSGQNAGANLGTIGTQVASNVGSNTIGAGNALAAGTVSSNNALTGALNSTAAALTSPNNATSNNSLLAQLLAAGSGNQYNITQSPDTVGNLV